MSPSTEYLAGFFDGEGSISLARTRRIGVSLRVQISNTNYDIVNMFYQTFGGDISYRDPKTYTHEGNISVTPQWHWRISGSNASEFLAAIIPYLMIKVRQAEIAIEFQNRRTGYFRSESEIKLDEADKVLIQSLNSSKGKHHVQTT